MGKLQIFQEYSFQTDKAKFHVAEGDVIRVKTSAGTYLGSLVKVGTFAEDFDIDTVDGIVTICCEDVIDIIPE